MNEISPSLLINLYLEPENALKVSLNDWQSIILILRYHQLLARYQFIFERAGIFEQLPAYVRHHLRNAKILSEKQYHQVFYEARELVQAYNFSTQHKIFLKGAAYTLAGQTAGKGRVYSDIDILVDKESLAKAEKSLFMSGWFSEKISNYDNSYYRNWTHEIPPLRHTSRGTILDIHYNLVPIISGRAPDISHFFEHIEVTEQGFSVFSPAAMTLHSIIHLFFNEDLKNGFRDFLDLVLLIKENSSELFWEELITLAKQVGFTLELSLACRYLSRLLGTEIPDNISAKLLVKPSYKQKIVDFIYLNALLPSHPKVENRYHSLANFLALIRGHWQKMPIHILIYHFIHRGYVSCTEYLFGKTFFLKEDKNHKF